MTPKVVVELSKNYDVGGEEDIEESVNELKPQYD